MAAEGGRVTSKVLPRLGLAHLQTSLQLSLLCSLDYRPVTLCIGLTFLHWWDPSLRTLSRLTPLTQLKCHLYTVLAQCPIRCRPWDSPQNATCLVVPRAQPMPTHTICPTTPLTAETQLSSSRYSLACLHLLPSTGRVRVEMPNTERGCWVRLAHRFYQARGSSGIPITVMGK